MDTEQLLGLIADMHGDGPGFSAALACLEGLGVPQILCAGDVAERGPDADEIISIMQAREIPSVAGNHDRSVVEHQDMWRQGRNPQRLRQLGRIVSDESLAYLAQLPDTLQRVVGAKRILVAHGVPWSDVVGVFPDTRQALIERLYRQYSAECDVLILGHTHQPMHLKIGDLHIINPGSIYGVTSRDSHTCAVVELPIVRVQLYDLRTLRATLLEPIKRG